MKRRNKIIVALSGIVLVLIIVPAWWIHLRAAREALDSDLVIAAKMGNAEDARMLLEQGADPNAREVADEPSANIFERFWRLLTTAKRQGVFQEFALTSAARSPHPYDTVKILLEHGASIQLAEKADGSPLFWASRGGAAAATQLLVERGANVNDPVAGFTPLVGAVLSGKREVVQILLDHGAGASQGSASMLGTALSLARQAKREDIVHLLEASRAKK